MEITLRKIKKAIKDPKRAFKYIIPKLSYNFDLRGYAPPPNVIYLSVNSICNARCKMCDVGQRVAESMFYKNLICDKFPQLAIERLKRLIDEVKNFKPLIAIISTEPLLYPDLIEFIEYAVKNDVPVQVTTNGILLPKFAKKFVEIGLQKLFVSMDGPKNIHNEIRGIPDIFERATEGMRIIRDEKKRLNKKYPSVNINYTISNYNYHCLDEFIESVSDLDIDTITFSHLNFVTEEMAKIHNEKFGECIGRATAASISMIDPSKVDIKILAEELEKVRKRKAELLFAPEIFTVEELDDFYNKPFKIIKSDRCKIVWNAAQILADGSLTPSTRCFEVKLGNINETSFLKAWNGEKMREFRKQLKKHKLFPVCTRCCAVL